MYFKIIYKNLKKIVIFITKREIQCLYLVSLQWVSNHSVIIYLIDKKIFFGVFEKKNSDFILILPLLGPEISLCFVSPWRQGY